MVLSYLSSVPDNENLSFIQRRGGWWYLPSLNPGEVVPQSYNQIIHWLRCSLSFSLLRSLILCLRGARSSGKPQLAVGDISLAVSGARI